MLQKAKSDRSIRNWLWKRLGTVDDDVLPSSVRKVRKILSNRWFVTMPSRISLVSADWNTTEYIRWLPAHWREYLPCVFQRKHRFRSIGVSLQGISMCRPCSYKENCRRLLHVGRPEKWPWHCRTYRRKLSGVHIVFFVPRLYSLPLRLVRRFASKGRSANGGSFPIGNIPVSYREANPQGKRSRR